MPEPLVSIGLVTWNSARYLSACLNAFARQHYGNSELIVVDNGSDDDSLQQVLRLCPIATVIRNGTNTGFCHAHNQAIGVSRGIYYLALNPDVEMQAGYIQELVRALEELEKCGSAVGKLLLASADNSAPQLDSAGLFLDRRRRQFIRGHGQLDQGQYDTAGEVFGPDGAAPLYRRTMLEDTRIEGQYFDESFFAHKEDVDLAWRARLFGWSCWYQPSALAFHHRSFRPGRRETISSDVKLHAVKNRYFLLMKNETSAGWRRDWPYILWYDLGILIYTCLFERSSLRALALLWQARMRLKSWRTDIRRRTRVSDREILGWFK